MTNDEWIAVSTIYSSLGISHSFVIRHSSFVIAEIAPPISLRLALVLAGLGIWYGTQALLKYRPAGSGVIGDSLHTLTARLFQFFTEHPKWADRLLIVSSLLIDLLGGFVLVQSIVGPSVRPFIGLFIVFSLRPICQAVCALPP